ncbi:hypothetical protein ACE6H2_016858 [Prunus campanulata]
MSSSSPHRSRGGGDNGISSKSKGEDRPRFLNSKAKSNCWAKADVVPGRHPELVTLSVSASATARAASASSTIT